MLTYAPSKTDAAESRQAREKAETAVQKRYHEALKAYHNQNATILQERTNLAQQVLAIMAELDGLEEAEKWLLLSMVIRNQSNLLGFMQDTSPSKDEQSTIS